METIRKRLGKYPHAALSDLADPVKKQTTRQLKVECEVCGYVVRMTQKWIDAAGTPICPTDELSMTVV